MEVVVSKYSQKGIFFKKQLLTYNECQNVRQNKYFFKFNRKFVFLLFTIIY